MKRTSIIVVVLVAALLSGCAGLGESLYRGQQASHSGTQIYKGQSADSVEKALGSPDVVSSGIFCKNAGNLPFGVMPAKNTVEWVYIGPTYSTLIYLDQGRVSYIHQIPNSQVRR
jgi:hypothetical protein